MTRLLDAAQRKVSHVSLSFEKMSPEEWAEFFQDRILTYPIIREFLKMGRSESDRSTETIHLAILQNMTGESFPEIEQLAYDLGFIRPRFDVSCLIRKNFLDQDLKEMGFSKGIVIPCEEHLPSLHHNGEDEELEAFPAIRFSDCPVSNLSVRFSGTRSPDDLQAGWGFVFENPASTLNH